MLFINFIESKLNVWGHTEVPQNNNKGSNSLYIQSNYKVLTQYWRIIFNIEHKRLKNNQFMELFIIQ